MKAIGKMTNNTVVVLKFGKRDQNLKGNIEVERKKVMVNIHGLMDLSMRENGKIIEYLEQEYTFGEMEGDIMVIGKIMICRVMEYIFGEMGEYMKDSTTQTKKKDLAFITGQTKEDMKVGG